MLKMQNNRKPDLYTTCLMLFVLAAFAIKSVLPAGFMPETGKGFTTLVICSGLGVKTISVPTDDAAPSGSHKKGSSQICAFGAVTTAQTLISLPPLSFVSLAYIAAPLAQATSNIEIYNSPFSLSARGPPSV